MQHPYSNRTQSDSGNSDFVASVRYLFSASGLLPFTIEPAEGACARPSTRQRL